MAFSIYSSPEDNRIIKTRAKSAHKEEKRKGGEITAKKVEESKREEERIERSDSVMK